MKNSLNIQSAGLTNVRNNMRARIMMALASTGFAGAMLIGGLSGSHAFQATSHTHMSQANAAVTSAAAFKKSVRTSGTKVMLDSYTTGNNASYYGTAVAAAERAGINSQYFVNQIQQESGFNPSATSPAGAEGIAQFMPGTASSMGINPWDPTQALYGAASMMAGLSAQFGGNYAKALAAYNAGPGAVQSAVAQGGGNWLAFTPGETQNYVAIIMG